MKAILINAEERKVEEVEIDASDFPESINRAIGSEIYTGGHYLPHGDAVLVDDEGLFTKQHFFTFRGAHQPFAGSGIILGADEQGETVPPCITLEQVRAAVTFQTREEVRDSL